MSPAPIHLTKRFLASVRPGPPVPKDEGWARSLLMPGELELWIRMPNPDRRHAVGVARRVRELLGDRADRPVLAAALLHDVGKTADRLRTPARVAATLVWLVLPDDRAHRWADRPGVRGKLGRYHLHPDIGADLLKGAGSAPLTVDWTAQHHWPESSWTLPPDLARALKDADDD